MVVDRGRKVQLRPPFPHRWTDRCPSRGCYSHPVIRFVRRRADDARFELCHLNFFLHFQPDQTSRRGILGYHAPADGTRCHPFYDAPASRSQSMGIGIDCRRDIRLSRSIGTPTAPRH